MLFIMNIRYQINFYFRSFNSLCNVSKAICCAFLFILVGVLFPGCEQDEPRHRDYPVVKTGSVNNITPDGARFHATVVSGDVESITEYGFVWGTSSLLDLQHSERIIIQESPTERSFFYDVTFALEPMEEYHVRPYVISGNFTVYGDVVSFMSLGSQAPVIDDFEPKTATWGDTLTIYGSNFSYRSGTNRVLFGEMEGRIIENTNERLRVVVPHGLNTLTSQIAVEVVGNRSTASEAFNLYSPVVIQTISPLVLAWQDTLLLSGTFPPEIPVTVSIDRINCQIAYKTSTAVGVIVPGALMDYEALFPVISFNNHSLTATSSFHLKEPAVFGTVNFSGSPGDQITLNGLFNPLLQNNTVIFSSGQTAVITAYSRNSLQFEIPEIDGGYHQTVDVISGGIVVMDDQPFTYDLPDISDLSPESGNQYNLLTITGSGFIPGHTAVYLGDQALTLTLEERTMLQARLPEIMGNGEYPLSIQVLDERISSDLTYTLKRPEIIDFYPKEATYGEIITLEIENFDNDLTVVLTGGLDMTIVSQSRTEIKVRMPDHIPVSFNTLQVWTQTYCVTARDYLVLKQPVLQHFDELSGRINQLISVEASYISPDPSTIVIQIGDYATPIQGVTPTGFVFAVPAIPQGVYAMNARIADYQFTLTERFTLTDTWSALTIKPTGISGDRNPGMFLLNDRAYIVAGDENYTYTATAAYFDILTNSWASVAGFPGTARSYLTGWAIQGMGYAGFGYDQYDQLYNDVYRYNPTANSWTPVLNPFPGVARRSAFSFTINGKAYVGGGIPLSGDYLTDLYEFDPDGETWSRKSDLPETYYSWIKACVVNNKAYVHAQRKIFIYNPAGDNWETRTIPPEISPFVELEIMFALDNAIYFIGIYSFPTKVWRYQVDTETWTALSDFAYGYKWGGLGFSHAGMGFYGLGLQDYGNVRFYKYNPLLEP